MTVGIARIADGGAASSGKRRDGRALLLNGARQLLAEKGYAGMELRDVAERGQAPRGSIYHHFPGGKASSRAEAAELEGRDDPRPDRTLAGGARPEADAARSSARSSAAASPTTPSGSAARSPPPPSPGPRTPSSPRSRPPPSRAGNGRSPRPCATKASTRREPRPSPASSSPRSRAPCCAPAPPATRPRSTRPSPGWAGARRPARQRRLRPR